MTWVSCEQYDLDRVERRIVADALQGLDGSSGSLRVSEQSKLVIGANGERGTDAVENLRG